MDFGDMGYHRPWIWPCWGVFDYSVRFLTFSSFGSWFIFCYFQPHTHTILALFILSPRPVAFALDFMALLSHILLISSLQYVCLNWAARAERI